MPASIYGKYQPIFVTKTMFSIFRFIADVAVQSRNRYGWSDVSRIIRFATGGESKLNFEFFFRSF